jgi:hypothetical protein
LPPLERRPSEYIEEHFHFGFMTDPIGIQLRDAIGVERMLWSSDYPHVSSDWPHSWRTILNALSGVPADERQLIIKTSALRLPALEARFRQLHPYDVPEFVVLPTLHGSADYLSWLAVTTAIGV